MGICGECIHCQPELSAQHQSLTTRNLNTTVGKVGEREREREESERKKMSDQENVIAKKWRSNGGASALSLFAGKPTTRRDSPPAFRSQCRSAVLQKPTPQTKQVAPHERVQPAMGAASLETLSTPAARRFEHLRQTARFVNFPCCLSCARATQDKQTHTHTHTHIVAHYLHTPDTSLFLAMKPLTYDFSQDTSLESLPRSSTPTPCRLAVTLFFPFGAGSRSH